MRVECSRDRIILGREARMLAVSQLTQGGNKQFGREGAQYA